jgi:hypothetical protein
MVCSVDATMTSPPPRRSRPTAVTAREAAAFVTVCSPPKLSAPDYDGGATGSTTSVAATSLLRAGSANGSA